MFKKLERLRDDELREFPQRVEEYKRQLAEFEEAREKVKDGTFGERLRYRISAKRNYEDLKEEFENYVWDFNSVAEDLADVLKSSEIGTCNYFDRLSIWVNEHFLANTVPAVIGASTLAWGIPEKSIPLMTIGALLIGTSLGSMLHGSGKEHDEVYFKDLKSLKIYEEMKEDPEKYIGMKEALLETQK